MVELILLSLMFIAWLLLEEAEEEEEREWAYFIIFVPKLTKIDPNILKRTPNQ